MIRIRFCIVTIRFVGINTRDNIFISEPGGIQIVTYLTEDERVADWLGNSDKGIATGKSGWTTLQWS